MNTYRVGYLIGSLATGSINRNLAKALVKLAPRYPFSGAMRRLSLLGGLIAIGVMSFSEFAVPQDSTAKQVTIAMSITPAPNVRREDVGRALQDLVAVVRKQPGCLDQVVLQSVVPSHRPSHVYISRWRTLADWEAMLANAEVRKVTNQYQPLFRLDRTAVYKPLLLTAEDSPGRAASPPQ
jgi:quinol monooxygenase YgiN